MSASHKSLRIKSSQPASKATVCSSLLGLMSLWMILAAWILPKISVSAIANLKLFYFNLGVQILHCGSLSFLNQLIPFGFIDDTFTPRAGLSILSLEQPIRVKPAPTFTTCSICVKCSLRLVLYLPTLLVYNPKIQLLFSFI